jgi:malate dehydrogenase
VAVTGAAGQVAYSMLARLASGEVFGPDTKVRLQLLEITPALTALEGVAMELEDCGFPTLAEVDVTDDAHRAFEGCNWALLVGAAPASRGWSGRTCWG